MEGQLVTPLRKKRLHTEELYTRIPEIETKLVELEGLSRKDLLAHVQIRHRDDPSYVPSECLVYFVRASRADNSTAGFDRLYKVLTERVLRSLPRPDSADGTTTSLTKSVIRDKVFGKLAELLSADRSEYSEKLDYFEVRFDGALASLRRDAQEQAWRDENRATSLDFDEGTGELSEEVERAAGSFEWSSNSEIDGADYRLVCNHGADCCEHSAACTQRHHGRNYFCNFVLLPVGRRRFFRIAPDD
jgi:hypothetical protein